MQLSKGCRRFNPLERQRVVLYTLHTLILFARLEHRLKNLERGL